MTREEERAVGGERREEKSCGCYEMQHITVPCDSCPSGNRIDKKERSEAGR